MAKKPEKRTDTEWLRKSRDDFPLSKKPIPDKLIARMFNQRDKEPNQRQSNGNDRRSSNRS